MSDKKPLFIKIAADAEVEDLVANGTITIGDIDFIDSDGERKNATLSHNVQPVKPSIDKKKMTKKILIGVSTIVCSVIAALISNYLVGSGNKAPETTTSTGAAIEVSGTGTYDTTVTNNIFDTTTGP